MPVVAVQRRVRGQFNFLTWIVCLREEGPVLVFKGISPMLRSILESKSESIQEIRLAADEKFFEAIALLSQQRYGSGIYLLGYTAEIILKIAALKLNHLAPHVPIGGAFGPIKNWMKQHYPAVSPEHYHSLWFWVVYVVEMRRMQQRPVNPDIESELLARVHRLYSIWWVTMRYRSDRASMQQAHDVFTDVSWLRKRTEILWS